MKNPFKRINPELEPPAQIEQGLFQRLSLIRFMLNITKLFTSDLMKTGIESIDGMKSSNTERYPDMRGMERDGRIDAEGRHLN